MLSQRNIKVEMGLCISNMHQPKRFRTAVYTHKHIAIVVTCIIASLILTVKADADRPHRPPPRPGPPRPGPMRPPHPDNFSEDIVQVENLVTTEPDTLDAVSTAASPLPFEEMQNTTIEDNRTDAPDEISKDVPDDCSYCDKDIVHDVMDDEKSKGEIKEEVLVVDHPKDSDRKPGESPLTSKEELNQMIEGLDRLLSNESAVVTINDVSDAFDQMDVLLATNDTTLEFPCAVLTSLDALGARADLNGSAAVATTREHIALVMADSAPQRPVRGLRIPVDGFSDEGFEVLQDELDPTTLSGDDTDAAVNLPASLAGSSRRISFVVWKTDRAFQRHHRDQYVVNSKIISVNVENFTQMGDGETIDIYLKPSIYEPWNMSRSCAYFHFTENDTGFWSQEGCTFIKSSSGLLDTCRCTHLTHFADILIPKAVFSKDNEIALEVISLIGCFLSLYGLLMIVLTAITFQSWRNDFNNKIWLQLTLALLINVVSFLIIIFYKFNYYNTFCMIIGITLHYAVLASFCWMLVAAVISYRKLVLVFAADPRRRLLKASVFSWLVPLIIVGTLVIAAPQSYTSRFEDYTPTGAFCYPSGLGLWLTVYTPITIVVISNWILFGLILRSVFGTKKVQKHGDSREMLRRASVSCLLVFLFGLPWVFGLFAYNIVAAYLFTLTTSYQGFVLFIFFIIINTKTRGMWLNKLHIKAKTKAQASSSLVTSKNAKISSLPEHTPFIDSNSSRTNITSLVSNSSDGRAVAYNVTSGSAVIEDSHYNSRDSDIDSYITAKSHDNFSEDDIFKSVEGIFDIKEDDDENSTMQNESVPISRTNSRNYILSNRSSLTKKDIQRNDTATSNKDDLSESSSRKVGYNDDFISPEITVYNVTTQNASLIT